jgi:hypothetical protein
MSRVSTVREGLRDNPIRLLLLLRSALVVLPGSVLAYGYGSEVLRLARGHFPLRPTLDISRNSLLLGLILLGIVAEFISYRVARVLNPGFYTVWALVLTFMPWELLGVIVFYVSIAALSALLWWLYGVTSPQRLRAFDAA